MRFFELFNLQDIVLYLFPAVVFIVLFGMALGYQHFRSSESSGDVKRPYTSYPEGLEDRRSPFPLLLILIIVGTAIWGFLYILSIGLLGVKI